MTVHVYCYCFAPALNKYIKILDNHISKLASTHELPGNVAKKVRVPGEPSQSNPPHDAPTWAVKKEYISLIPDQGILFFRPLLLIF